MRMPYKYIATIAVAFLLTSCSTTGQPPTQVASNFIYKQNVVNTSKQQYPRKNPKSVALYSKKEPHTAYRVIGVATVSKYNLLGMQRQELTMENMMKKLA